MKNYKQLLMPLAVTVSLAGAAVPASAAASAATAPGTPTITTKASAPTHARIKTVKIKDPETGKITVTKAKIATGNDSAGLRRNAGWWQWVWTGAWWALKWVVRVCSWTACWTYISW